MTDPTSQLSDDSSELETALEAFSSAWDENATPPDLGEYTDSVAPGLRGELLGELVKLDLERRWQCGLRRLIEDYFSEFPQLRQLLSPELILEEHHIRLRAGDSIRTDEYHTRFPEHASAIENLWRLNPQQHPTVIVDASGPEMLDLQPGESIGDFDLLLRLGQGAFATVFLARQRSMQRLLAVKISSDRGSEPQTLAQLDHENIIRVYDQLVVPERQLRLMYMQYASGGTLAAVMERMTSLAPQARSGAEFLKALDAGLDLRGESAPADSSTRRKLRTLTWDRLVCWIGSQLARALDYAHRRGVLHRDLKPANVLLTNEGIPKLADFNISYSSQLSGTSAAADLGGSLAYMSPEHLEACDPRHSRAADELDGRCDLFSLGVLLWELRCGERPFPDDIAVGSGLSRIEAMARRRYEHGPDFGTWVTHPDNEVLGLSQVLSRCLLGDRTQRYANGHQLARELELCQQPEAKRLTQGPTTGWLSLVPRYPLLSILLVTVGPNLVAGVFNLLYNRNELLQRVPSAEPTFMKVQSIINMIVYPLGIVLGIYFGNVVTMSVKQRAGETLTGEELFARRQRCLQLGNYAVAISVGLWLVAGIAFPITLHLLLGGVPAVVYSHFVASLAISGLIAAAYPFLAVSSLAVRCFYPSLMRWDSIRPEDIEQLRKLSRQVWFYLVLGASMPMFAVAILVSSGSTQQFQLLSLAIGGALCFVWAAFQSRSLQTDLALWIKVLSNEE